MKVMIATDGTETAVHAARTALGLLHPEARVELVTVVAERMDPEADAGGFEGPVITEEEADRDWQDAVAAGRDALARTEQALGLAPDGSRLVPSSGRVAEALYATAREAGADVLVLGSDQPGWWDRLVHGSVEDQLVHHAPCPLLIVSRPS